MNKINFKNTSADDVSSSSSSGSSSNYENYVCLICKESYEINNDNIYKLQCCKEKQILCEPCLISYVDNYNKQNDDLFIKCPGCSQFWIQYNPQLFDYIAQKMASISFNFKKYIQKKNLVELTPFPPYDKIIFDKEKWEHEICKTLKKAILFARKYPINAFYEINRIDDRYRKEIEFHLEEISNEILRRKSIYETFLEAQKNFITERKQKKKTDKILKFHLTEVNKKIDRIEKKRHQRQRRNIYN